MTKICAIALIAAGASADVYTDRSAFEDAVGPVLIETFADSPLVGTTYDGGLLAMAFDDFDVASKGPAIKVIDRAFAGSYSTSDDDRYLYLDTDIGFIGSSVEFRFEPTHAVGFDFTGVGEVGNEFTIMIDGQFIEIASGGEAEDGFFGYTSESTFSTFVVATTTDSAYGVDQVTFATVPAPATLGVLGVMGRRRRRR
ncbi:MAG: hypothetical protein KDA28_09010, partial [Phycisphaerales bacterium]|nr:hypothetical protein [Phycisphaerales bacterium]